MLLDLLKKHKIYDEHSFMKYRQNLYNFVASINGVDIIKFYDENELYRELVEVTKIEYEKDLFSEMFMQLGTNSKGLKQLFTPFSITKLMSDIVNNQDYGLIYEPTCGTGANIFPVMKTWCEQNTFDKLLRVEEYNRHFVVAQDLDPINCSITALNLSLRGINGLVLNMDTLENDNVKEAYMIFNENGIAGISSIHKYTKKEDTKKIYNYWINRFFKKEIELSD